MLPQLFALLLATQDAPAGVTLPSADEIVAKMVERDNARRSALQGYTSTRRYVLENAKLHKQAEMVVRMTYGKNGSKQFEIVSSSGWNGVRKHVFPRLLEAETDAARPGAVEDSRMTPQNYSFAMVRMDAIDGRKAYVIEVTPKQAKKYLMRGTIWVDTEELAVVRMTGAPAKNPSFWIKSVQFSHTYGKHGPFWLAASDRSISDARIFGSTELRIEYSDYTFNDTVALQARLP